MSKRAKEAADREGAFHAEFPDAFRWLRDKRFEDEVAKFEAPRKYDPNYVENAYPEPKPNFMLSAEEIAANKAKWDYSLAPWPGE